MEEAIRKEVEQSLNSNDLKLEIDKKLEEGRRWLNEEVTAQLEKEKEAALVEARQKEVLLIFTGTTGQQFGSSTDRCLRNVHLWVWFGLVIVGTS